MSAFEFNEDPDPGTGPDRDPGIWWPKILRFPVGKIIPYIPSYLLEEHLSYRRSLQPSKENIQHFKTWKQHFFTFFLILCGLLLVFTLLDPILIWIRILLFSLQAFKRSFLLFTVTFTSVFKVKKLLRNHKTVKQNCSSFFLLADGGIQIRTNNYGSGFKRPEKLQILWYPGNCFAFNS